MFLHSLGSTDSRFKHLTFRAGLNLLVAEQSEKSVQGDSRNGTGKSSFVRVLRYVLGGDPKDALLSPALDNHTFFATISLSMSREDTLQVRRPLRPRTRVHLMREGSETEQLTDRAWVDKLGTSLFALPEISFGVTSNTLFGQLARYYFDEPVKTFPQESSVAVSKRLGHLLGFSLNILDKAGEYARLEKQHEALRKAATEGALPQLREDEGSLRAQLAVARRDRERLETNLQNFRVDAQYSSHQTRADELTAKIKQANEELLSVRRRSSELEEAIRMEIDSQSDPGLASRLEAAYKELQIILPELVVKRFDEVANFHTSIIANRRSHLQSELDEGLRRIDLLRAEISRADAQRAETMRLLDATMALDTFQEMQGRLGDLTAQIGTLEQKLESALLLENLAVEVDRAKNAARSALRTEYEELDHHLEWVMAKFSELGEMIYHGDRQGLLEVTPGPKGILKVEPTISGDSSDGVKSVKTFLLDIVSMMSALRLGRVPPILVHDSKLFDSVDPRQVADCLQIGAVMAEQYNFQYVVTLNTDKLRAAEEASEGKFVSDPYILDTVLSDLDEDGGLFGFRFD